MEFELKTLSPEAVPRALAKAERYRLLNEPGEAESICLDALAVEPGNQAALTVLLLAQTEQFEHGRVDQRGRGEEEPARGRAVGGHGLARVEPLQRARELRHAMKRAVHRRVPQDRGHRDAGRARAERRHHDADREGAPRDPSRG